VIFNDAHSSPSPLCGAKLVKISRTTNPKLFFGITGNTVACNRLISLSAKLCFTRRPFFFTTLFVLAGGVTAAISAPVVREGVATGASGKAG